MQQHAPVYGNEACQLTRLVLAREEDCVVGVAERADPPVGDVRDLDRRLGYGGDGASSLPSARWYSRPTTDHASCTMNLT